MDLLDALNESIAEDEGSLLDDLSYSESAGHHHDETVTHCSTLLADLSPSSTQSLATQSIDALVARTGPLPPLPFRSLAATKLVDVDYCRIQIESVNLFDTGTGDAGDEWLASQCRSELKTLGQDAQLCLRYELPPLTSNPEIAGGGARAFVDDNDRRTTVTVGSVSRIYPLPSSSATRDGRVTTNRRRIGSKSKGLTANAREKPRSSVGGSCGGVFQLKHSNLLAIAFVSDKDVASWGGSIAIELVCNTVGVVDKGASADSPRLASCSFPLEDVLRSRSFDVRAKLDLLPLGAPPSSSPEAIGSLVARVALIGGDSCAETDNEASEPTYTTLPIVESPQESSVAASDRRLVEERRNELAVDDSSVPPKSSSRLQDHEVAVRGKPSLQIPNVPPTTSDLSLLHPPSAPLSAPSPQHRHHLECQPVVHPSDTRVVLERQGRQNEHAARRIQTCVRDHLLRRRWQRQAEKEEQFDPDVPMESPPPPPPPTPSAPLTSGRVPFQGGSTPAGSPLSEPCRPCDISSLGDCSPQISSPKNVVESDLDTPPPRAELRFCIRLGSCKGLVEVVSTWQEPGLCLLESSAAVAVSCTIFEGLERLEATFYSKALPLHLSTSSFDFDSKQMVAISLSDKSAVEYLQNETLKVELWLLPASHSSTLESTGAATFAANIIDKNLVATASLSLVPLLDCSGGCRQNISWRPTGWLGEERVGSIELAIFREGVPMDQLEAYSGDTFSLSGASSVRDPCEEDGNAAIELCTPGDAMDNDGTRQAVLPSVSSPSLHSSTGSALKTPRNSGSDSDGSDGTTNSISSRRSSSDTATGSSSDTSTSTVSSGGSSGGSSSRSSEGDSIGEARSLSGVMDSLESVKRTLSRHFDGNVESDKDDADENGDGTGTRSSLSVTKNSLRREQSNGGQDATLRGTSFADIGTSPIDPGTLVENSGPMDPVPGVACSTTSEEAASQTDTDGGIPSHPIAGRRSNRSTNTEPLHFPSSSSTGSSDSDTVLVAATPSTTPSHQNQRHGTSLSSPSGFRRRRRLLPPSNAVDSPATNRALTRARIPLEYRSSRSSETALSRHLCNTDRISSIMAQYSRPSGILRPPTYSSSSSSSSDGEDDSDNE